MDPEIKLPSEKKRQRFPDALLLMNRPEDTDAAWVTVLRSQMDQRLIVATVNEQWTGEGTPFQLYFQTQLKSALKSFTASAISSVMIPYNLGGTLPTLGDVRGLCGLVINFFEANGLGLYSLIVTVPTPLIKQILSRDKILQQYKQLSWQVVEVTPELSRVMEDSLSEETTMITPEMKPAGIFSDRFVLAAAFPEVPVPLAVESLSSDEAGDPRNFCTWPAEKSFELISSSAAAPVVQSIGFAETPVVLLLLTQLQGGENMLTNQGLFFKLDRKYLGEMMVQSVTVEPGDYTEGPYAAYVEKAVKEAINRIPGKSLQNVKGVVLGTYFGCTLSGGRNSEELLGVVNTLKALPLSQDSFIEVGVHSQELQTVLVSYDVTVHYRPNGGRLAPPGRRVVDVKDMIKFKKMGWPEPIHLALKPPLCTCFCFSWFAKCFSGRDSLPTSVQPLSLQ